MEHYFNLADQIKFCCGPFVLAMIAAAFCCTCENSQTLIFADNLLGGWRMPAPRCPLQHFPTS